MEPPPITSRTNARVKRLVALRQPRERRETGLTLVDGAREILRAIEAGASPVEAYLCEELAGGPLARAVLERLDSLRTTVYRVSPPVFEKIAFGNRTDGVVLVARAEARGLAGLELPKRPVVAVLEGVEKPGNLGAIVRTADGAGVDAIVAVGVTDLFNPNAIRASVGAVFSPRVRVAEAGETLAWLRDLKLPGGDRPPIYTTRPDAERCFPDIDLSTGAVLVFGSEAHGLSPAWEAPTAGIELTPISLPMRGVADSLNVSATAAVLFYEALRQREK